MDSFIENGIIVCVFALLDTRAAISRNFYGFGFFVDLLSFHRVDVKLFQTNRVLRSTDNSTRFIELTK